MKRFLTIATLAISLTACVAQQALLKPTSSGYPEGVFEIQPLILYVQGWLMLVHLGEFLSKMPVEARLYAARQCKEVMPSLLKCLSATLIHNTRTKNSFRHLPNRSRCKSYCSTVDWISNGLRPSETAGAEQQQPEERYSTTLVFYGCAVIGADKFQITFQERVWHGRRNIIHRVTVWSTDSPKN